MSDRTDPPDDQLPSEQIETVTPEKVQAGSPGKVSVIDEVMRGAGLDPRDPKVSRVRETIETTILLSGSSPLPPAILLEQWEVLHPGITAKYVAWADIQGRHRRGLETTRTNRSEARQDRGQLIAAFIAIAGLAAAIIIALNTQTWAGAMVASVCAIVGVGGVAAATIVARGFRVPTKDAPARANPARRQQEMPKADQ